MTMEFHEPDQTWAALGCESYEDYLEKYLVRARFHEKVPKEIRDAYITIEFIMAHSYYYYPMYDEALSKLLRTMEMALKLKCIELGINIVKSIKSNGVEIKFSFGELIKMYHESEPNKRLDVVLNGARNIRNYFMHPERNSFAGLTLKHSLLTCINTINILFAPKNHFEIFIEKLGELQDETQKFKDLPLVLEYDNNRYLVHRIKFIDVFISSEMERQCLFIEFVLNDLGEENMMKLIRPVPMFLYTEKIDFANDFIVGHEAVNNLQFKILISKKKEDLERFENYNTYLETIKKKHFMFYETLDSQTNNVITNFRYEYYHKLLC